MKYLKYLILLLPFLIYSCGQDSFEYLPDNECVSFADVTESYILDGNNLEIEIVRGTAVSVLNLNISLAEGSIFSLVDGSVTFEAGEYTAKVLLTYDQTNLVPGVEYSFNLSFDESLRSPAGTSAYVGNGVLPLDMLEYEDYGIIEFIGPTSSNYLSDVVDNMTVEEKRYTLQVAKNTTTYYRIKNFFSSPTDLDFILSNDGTVTVLAPETSWDCPVYQGETYCFATTASYKGENFTVWFDADPSCITPYDWSPAGYSATIGTTIDFDAIFTIGSDYIPRTDSDNMWHAYETFEVISLF